MQKGRIEKLRSSYYNLRHLAVEEMTKELNKEQAEMAIELYAGNNIYIKRAIEKAEKQGNEKEAQELRESVLANGLKEEKLQSFDKYLELIHQYKIIKNYETGDEVLLTLK